MKPPPGECKLPNIFSASTTDLEQAVAYELDAIEYFRATLFGQQETVGANLSFTLGDTTPDGTQNMVSAAVGSSKQSERAVRSALNRVSPLAFVAAFKLQDMVAEWILRANGVTEWAFNKKLASYDKLRSNGSFVRPVLFAQRILVESAFWELYRAFFPFRNAATHSGGLVLRADGVIEITSEKSGKLSLPADEQASYMRAVSLLTKSLIGRVPHDEFLEALIESDMLKLERHHHQQGFAVQQARLATLNVQVPAAYINGLDPLSVVIDFDHLRRTAERGCGANPNDRVCFSVSLSVPLDSQDAVWKLPMDSIPTGNVSIREGDPRFDPFLWVVPRGQDV